MPVSVRRAPKAEHIAGRPSRAPGYAAQVLVLLAAALASMVIALTGTGTGLERELQTGRDSLRHKAATGRVVLVELDAKSLAALPTWPWPRHLYAEAIAALERAGADLIVFDIDFSARSLPDEDRALATAVAHARSTVVLPTFLQSRSQTDQTTLENLPLPELRDHAALAAVNIFADSDGLVRSYPFGLSTGGVLRPSVGAILANRSGTGGRVFPIDGAIEPATVPRISFVDLLHGRVAPNALKGKSVVIGATAIDLGDHYPTPGHRVLPGSLIQALAAETLLQGSSPVSHGPLVPVLIVLCALLLTSRLEGRVRIGGLAVLGLALLGLPLATEWASFGTLEIVPALAAVLTSIGCLAADAARQALRQARLSDPVTGLPNRRSLEETIKNKTPAGTLLVVRIGSFGDVVGLLGQAKAAQLVLLLQERLTLATTAQAYRSDADSLGCVLPRLTHEQQEELLEAVIGALRGPVQLAGKLIDQTLALGLAEFEGADADAIGRALMAADSALASGLRWQRHSEDLSRESDRRLTLVGDLDGAIAAGDIWVAYQPKLDIRSGRIASVEALVRWRHPERGPIPPDAFIPLLEESGRIADLTLHVLETVLRDMVEWSSRGLDIRAAVNVSAILPADPAFMSGLESVLSRFPVSPCRLTLEVTESIALTNADAALAALHKIAALGIQLSIDDYGTGQSTLTYLKKLPASEIKIDKSFVLGLEFSRSDQVMVRSTIDLAHELGYKVVAEGIETAAVLEMLRGYGCDAG